MPSIKTVLLDMDGVLVDFAKGVGEFFDIDMDAAIRKYPERPVPWYWIYEATGRGAREFWQTVNEDFWVNMSWTSEGKELLRVLEKKFSATNICILTNPSGQASAFSGKLKWIAREMPGYRDRVLFGLSKQFCASPTRLLIDDAEHNIESFVNHGGKGLVFPRPWNSSYFITNPVAAVEAFLLTKKEAA